MASKEVTIASLAVSKDRVAISKLMQSAKLALEPVDNQLPVMLQNKRAHACRPTLKLRKFLSLHSKDLREG